MFDKKETHHHHMSEKAAKAVAKGEKKAAKIAARGARDAAQIAADANLESAKAEVYAAAQDRLAREREAEMAFARENPDQYLEIVKLKKQQEKEETDLQMKIVKYIGIIFLCCLPIAFPPLFLLVIPAGIGYFVYKNKKKKSTE